MHPLLDRRDLTAQRDAAARGPHAPALELGGVTAQLAEINRYLCALLEQDRAEITQLCVTDNEPAQSAMDNFPVPGTRRLIVRRPGAGGLYTLAAAVPQLVLQPNDNRLGGQIVNTGANAVTLYLSHDLLVPGTATPLPAGAAQIVLNGNGGAWDLRLSNLLWCGGILAVAAAGGSSVSIAEV
jgi:hypothetical protein